ncbi:MULTISPECIES: YIP1 family protein [Halolamina]|uniref:Yip1 domain-containing protein n=1 Tax=Halolamina pelagica TaxID=699431 RepID=A0A1I5RR29_9EURY|nr:MULTISPECIES: YIP1 family protein [Halolamina]NHX35303.1 YIP1 family protein [Halolamina sp. R1-12]SFP61004.1 Yip1 domain-containing protein [Halolamina pelagica]
MAGPRTPLLRPDRYFREHDGSPPLAHAAAVVAVVTVAVAAGMAVFLDQFAAALDTTVTVDNPAYPGDAFCEDGTFDRTPSGCGEPKTVERNLGAMVVEELSWLPPASVVLVPLWWLWHTTVLYGAGRAAGGSGNFAEIAAVAGWGMAPSLLRLVAVLGFTVRQLRSVSVPADPESAIAVLQSAIVGVEVVGLIAVLLVGVWAGAIRAYGLADAHGIPVPTAATVVAGLTLVGFVFELA